MTDGCFPDVGDAFFRAEPARQLLRVAALEVIGVTDQTETVGMEGRCHASGHSLCEGQRRKCGC